MKSFRKNLKGKSRRRNKTAHSKHFVSKNQVYLCHRCDARHKNKNAGRLQQWPHPDIKKSVKISKSRSFGRYIKATQSMDVGTVAIVTAPFASGMWNCCLFTQME